MKAGFYDADITPAIGSQSAGNYRKRFITGIRDNVKSTGGGYETILTSYSNLEPAAGRIIADACIALAGKINPGEVPHGPQVERPVNPLWTYGTALPEIE